MRTQINRYSYLLYINTFVLPHSPVVVYTTEHREGDMPLFTHTTSTQPKYKRPHVAARRPSYEVDRGERGREGAQIPEDVDERLPEVGLDVRDAVLGREGLVRVRVRVKG